MLLSYNADVNLCDNGNLSPLFTASEEGHIDVVQLLLQYNADVNLCSDTGTSTLLVASLKGHVEIVQLLLQNNSDTAICWASISPLYRASEYGRTKIVEMLLKYNADIYACAYDGASPLFVAATKGHYTVVEILLKHAKKSEENWKRSNQDLVCDSFLFQLWYLLHNLILSYLTQIVNSVSRLPWFRPSANFGLHICKFYLWTNLVILTEMRKRPGLCEYYLLENKYPKHVFDMYSFVNHPGTICDIKAYELFNV